MKKATKNDLEEIIDLVQKIRSRNNELWMDLLRIASRHAKDEVVKVLKEINANDKAISKLLGEIK